MARSIRVVIVDDEADVRALLRLAIVGDPRFDLVGEAENGQQAVAMVAATQPDAVILDSIMPEMTGVEAVPLIREKSPGSHIVMWSASPFVAAHVRIGHDVDALFDKGEPVREVIETVARVCRT